MNKLQKGITLISLIITIVILIILATVTINSIDSSNTINYAQNTVNNYEVAQEKEKLQEEVLEWQLVKGSSLQSYLSSIYGNVVYNSVGCVRVTTQSGRSFIVTERGEVTYVMS